MLKLLNLLKLLIVVAYITLKSSNFVKAVESVVEDVDCCRLHVQAVKSVLVQAVECVVIKAVHCCRLLCVLTLLKLLNLLLLNLLIVVGYIVCSREFVLLKLLIVVGYYVL